MTQNLYAWGSIISMTLTSTVGDVLMSKAMKRIGDLDQVRRQSGIFSAVKRVLGSELILWAVVFMALSFYILLFALSHADVSLVVPAAASLTFVSNAIAAKFFLHENVNRRRWAAAVFVCCGVALLAA